MKGVLLFRVDGGHVFSISMGHLIRALTLAKKLQSQYEIIFVSKNYPDGIAYIRKFGFDVEIIETSDDSDITLNNLCDKYSPQTIVIDLFSCPYVGFFEYARSRKYRTIVFDTLGRLKGVADIVINDTLVKDFADYSNLNHQSKLFLGPEYFMIDNPPEIIAPRDTVKDIMITFGGSDPTGLTAKVLQVLLKMRIAENVHVILGPAFTEHQRIHETAKEHKFITIHNNPDNFFEILNQQDIVICAAGRTLYECAYFGKPVVIVPSIEHETITAIEYAGITGSFYTNIWNNTETPSKIIEFLDIYKNNFLLRRSICDASTSLVDNSGIKRILDVICQ